MAEKPPKINPNEITKKPFQPPKDETTPRYPFGLIRPPEESGFTQAYQETTGETSPVSDATEQVPSDKIASSDLDDGNGDFPFDLGHGYDAPEDPEKTPHPFDVRITVPPPSAKKPTSPDISDRNHDRPPTMPEVELGPALGEQSIETVVQNLAETQPEKPKPPPGWERFINSLCDK